MLVRDGARPGRGTGLGGHGPGRARAWAGTVGRFLIRAFFQGAVPITCAKLTRRGANNVRKVDCDPSFYRFSARILVLCTLFRNAGRLRQPPPAGHGRLGSEFAISRGAFPNFQTLCYNPFSADKAAYQTIPGGPRARTQPVSPKRTARSSSRAPDMQATTSRREKKRARTVWRSCAHSKIPCKCADCFRII